MSDEVQTSIKLFHMDTHLYSPLCILILHFNLPERATLRPQRDVCCFMSHQLLALKTHNKIINIQA